MGLLLVAKKTKRMRAIGQRPHFANRTRAWFAPVRPRIWLFMRRADRRLPTWTSEKRKTMCNCWAFGFNLKRIHKKLVKIEWKLGKIDRREEDGRQIVTNFQVIPHRMDTVLGSNGVTVCDILANLNGNNFEKFFKALKMKIVQG